MKKLAAALLFAALGFAQQPEMKTTLGIAHQPEMKTKVIEVKFAKASDTTSLIHAVGGISNIQVSPDNRFLVLLGTPEGLAAAENLVKQVDVSPKNIDLTFYILSASPQPNADKPPAELEPVIKQLRSAFVYQGYKVLETTLMRVREGNGGELSGRIAGGETIYHISCQRSRVTSGTPNVIRLDNLMIGGKFPTTNAKGETHWMDTGIKTDVDMKEGQKIVVGKSTMNDAAAFLVVSAKVLD
jgi:hypothetical protein